MRVFVPNMHRARPRLPSNVLVDIVVEAKQVFYIERDEKIAIYFNENTDDYGIYIEHVEPVFAKQFLKELNEKGYAEIPSTFEAWKYKE